MAFVVTAKVAALSAKGRDIEYLMTHWSGRLTPASAIEDGTQLQASYRTDEDAHSLAFHLRGRYDVTVAVNEE